ncbi:MAG: caspase family protein [Chryseotalea sp.]
MKKILIVVLWTWSTLAHAQQLETVLQQGHELGIVALATNADSTLLATGSKDKTIKLWQLQNTRELRTLFGHEKSVTALAFVPQKNLLVSGSNDATLRLWDLLSGKELTRYSLPDIISSVVVHPSGSYVVAAGYANDAYVLSLPDFNLIKKFEVNADKGNGSGIDLAFSPDGKLLAVGEDNRTCKVYTTQNFELKKEIKPAEGWCGGCGTRIAFKNNNLIYIATENGTLSLYNLIKDKTEAILINEIDDLSGLSLSNTGTTLALATDKKIFLFKNNSLTKEIVAEDEVEFTENTFYPNSENFLQAQDNSRVNLVNSKTFLIDKKYSGFLNDRDLGSLQYNPNSYWDSYIARYIRFKNQIIISDDGKQLLKGKFGNKIKQWDIATGKPSMEFKGHDKTALTYLYYNNGKNIISGGGDGKIIFWNTATGDTTRTIASYREPIFTVQINQQADKVLSTSWDGSMKIHQVKDGKLLHYFNLNNYSAYCAGFHPNDLYVFTGRMDHSVQMWEIDTKKIVRDFIGHTDIISSLQSNNDGSILLTASWDGTARLWNVSAGLALLKLKHDYGAIHTAIFHPDYKKIYTAGTDRIIREWDAQNGKLLRTFIGHQAEVTSLLIQPNSQMLISHAVDGVTKFWDLSTSKSFYEHIHLGESDYMVKNPDGYFNATSGARQYIHFVKGLETFAADQFFQDFYKPDIMPQLFKSRGVDKKSVGMDERINLYPPPVIKINAIKINEEEAEVYVKVSHSGNDIAEVRLQHNGKQIKLTSLPNWPKEKNQSVIINQKIKLVGGKNTFEAVGINTKRVESYPQQAEIVSALPAKNSVCHLFVVGINEYKNPRMSLQYAKPDASSFSEILNQSDNNLFQEIRLISLFDAQANKNNILKKLDSLSSVIQPEDVFVFYYAGHGSMVDNQFYFIPTESSRLYDGDALNKEAIEAGVMQQKLSAIKALKQLIVMDACQSGGSVEVLATRGAAEEKAIAQLSRASGIHVMASAGSDQFATEFSSLGHGLFTYVLMKALQGEADGAPKDGKVTIYELKSYLDDQVPEMTRKLKGKPQYPHTFSRGQDFPILMHGN